MHRLVAKIKLKTRFKKINEKTEWYKRKAQPKIRLKYWGNKRVEREKKGCENDPPVAPIFFPRTHGGKLAMQLREAEREMNKNSRRRVKVIEEEGNTLTSLLFSPDPWSDQRGVSVSSGQSCIRANVCYAKRRGKCSLSGQNKQKHI